MVGGDVEGVEIVVFVFNLGTVENGETEGDEEVLDFSLNAGDGVQMAHLRAGRGEREIQPLGREASFQGCGVELALTGFEGGFQRLLGGIEQLADARRGPRGRPCPCLCWLG